VILVENVRGYEVLLAAERDGSTERPAAACSAATCSGHRRGRPTPSSGRAGRRRLAAAGRTGQQLVPLDRGCSATGMRMRLSACWRVEHGHQRAAHGQAGAVQGVHQFVLALRRS
jgi:hypothetical protein